MAFSDSSTYNLGMKTDALIIGSGLAGLALALKLADQGQNVLLCTKTHLEGTNSAMAQGGIAAVLSGQDSFEQHVRDTLVAGAGLCQESVVREVVSQGPDRIQEVIDWGVHFDMDDPSRLALTREGGHSQRRIVHIADHTGLAIHQVLSHHVRNHPKIHILENHFAVDLLMNRKVSPLELGLPLCLGAYLLNRNNGEVAAYQAHSTFLACGGAGKAYLYTSNWGGATGDGIAMAYRAGARVANMEFMQFHPTCLHHPHTRNFLISEALRGEGAELVDHNGQAFMKRYHPLGSLAPRDIVARSIDAEMKKSGQECVYLDITNTDIDLAKRFPHIYEKCRELGIQIEKQPIPVVPAAHYLCGGVLTGLDGSTDIESLYVIGESACTGLHGANRLASNSLLECLVMAHESFRHYMKRHQEGRLMHLDYEIPPWKQNEKEDADELIVISHTWDEIRRLMWNYMGIVRTTRRLERAQHRLALIAKEVKENYSNFRTHADIEELRNIALVAELSVQCALMRKESRGIHYCLDYPETLPTPQNSIV